MIFYFLNSFASDVMSYACVCECVSVQLDEKLFICLLLFDDYDSNRLNQTFFSVSLCAYCLYIGLAD